FELRESRRMRRRLLEHKDRVLHPLVRHGLRRLRSSPSRRLLHYVGLFFGFLLGFYVLMLLGQGIVALLPSWRELPGKKKTASVSPRASPRGISPSASAHRARRAAQTRRIRPHRPMASA